MLADPGIDALAVATAGSKVVALRIAGAATRATARSSSAGPAASRRPKGCARCGRAACGSSTSRAAARAGWPARAPGPPRAPAWTADRRAAATPRPGRPRPSPGADRPDRCPEQFGLTLLAAPAAGRARGRAGRRRAGGRAGRGVRAAIPARRQGRLAGRASQVRRRRSRAPPARPDRPAGRAAAHRRARPGGSTGRALARRPAAGPAPRPGSSSRSASSTTPSSGR